VEQAKSLTPQQANLQQANLTKQTLSKQTYINIYLNSKLMKGSLLLPATLPWPRPHLLYVVDGDEVHVAVLVTHQNSARNLGIKPQLAAAAAAAAALTAAEAKHQHQQQQTGKLRDR
jgi:hypothetical protein